MADDLKAVEENLEVPTSGRTKRLGSAPPELASGGLLEEMKKIQEERKKQKLEMLSKEKDLKEDDVMNMKVLVEPNDARLGCREEIMSSSGDTVSCVVDRYLERCGGVVGSSGYLARDSGGMIVNMGDSLAEAGIKDGDLLLISCKNYEENEGKPSRRLCPWRMISLVCGLVCLLTMVCSITAWCLSYTPADRYLVLLDAGSVHTSVYTYRYSYPEPAGPVRVTESNFCELGQTGISSFKADPQGAARFISSSNCVLSSISGIPPASRPLSSVLLGSTAGMRVLNLAIPDTAQQILGNLTRELGLVSLGMKSGARILGGEEEGVDGWVTANYLKGGLGEKEQMGALDWGGASSQITRVVEEQSQANKKLALYGKKYNLLARSNLCYGQAEALNRHRASLVYSMYNEQGLVHQNQTDIFVPDPCLPQGSSTKPTSLGQLYSSPCTSMVDMDFMNMVRKSNKNITFYSQHYHTACSSTVLNLFTPTNCTSLFVPQSGEATCLDPATIPHPGDVKYLAFSTYWYLTHGLGLPPSFPLERFIKITSHLCSLNKTSPMLVPLGPVADMACFQATFMNHLLTKAYHFNSTTWPQISFVKRIADAEVGWGLGHAIAQANNVAPPEGRQYISLPVLVVLLSISGFLLLICVATALQGMFMRREYTRLPGSA